MLSWLPSGTMYSSMSKDASHLVCGPKRLRQEASAAYCEDRSPGSELAGFQLLQMRHGQSMRVTLLEGNKSVMGARDVASSSSSTDAPLLS